MRAATSRQRWFCSLCGALIPREPITVEGLARCTAHSKVPLERDLIPPDPLAELPTLAAEADAQGYQHREGRL